MPMIQYSDEDILRGKVVTPAWYRVRIGRFSEEQTKAGDSNNWVFTDSIILHNADNGSDEFKGVPIKILFSSKPTAKGFTQGFYAALNNGESPVSGSRWRIEDAEGKEIDAFVENNLYEGRVSNRINHKYRVPRAA